MIRFVTRTAQRHVLAAAARTIVNVAAVSGNSSSSSSNYSNYSWQQQMRSYSLKSDVHRKRNDELSDAFVEARDEIEYAVESKDTTYFNEEFEAAKIAVDEALALHAAIMNDIVDVGEKAEYQRETGLKMEQLKQELELLAEEDH